jgi:hypothetical protein
MQQNGPVTARHGYADDKVDESVVFQIRCVVTHFISFSCYIDSVLNCGLGPFFMRHLRKEAELGNCSISCNTIW